MDASKLKCPNCGTNLNLVGKVKMPPEQRMAFKITHEHPLLSAKTIYGTLENLEKILRAQARDLGRQCHVFVEKVESEPGSTTFHLFVADHDVKKTQSKKTAP